MRNSHTIFFWIIYFFSISLHQEKKNEMSLRTKEQLEELYAKSRERQAKKRKKRRRFIILDIETAGMDGTNAFDADEMYKKLRELLTTDNERYERDNSVK